RHIGPDLDLKHLETILSHCGHDTDEFRLPDAVIASIIAPSIDRALEASDARTLKTARRNLPAPFVTWLRENRDLDEEILRLNREALIEDALRLCHGLKDFRSEGDLDLFEVDRLMRGFSCEGDRRTYECTRGTWLTFEWFEHWESYGAMAHIAPDRPLEARIYTPLSFCMFDDEPTFEHGIGARIDDCIDGDRICDCVLESRMSWADFEMRGLVCGDEREYFTLQFVRL
ncbi:MAG: hypothetical protein GVY34_03120, partial [Alphaproteobacteria bacterium]|nr:hypothetical protein [Alphaproteobacteria bacterium]